MTNNPPQIPCICGGLWHGLYLWRRRNGACDAGALGTRRGTGAGIGAGTTDRGGKGIGCCGGISCRIERRKGRSTLTGG